MKISSVKTYRVQHKLPYKIGVSTFMYQTRDAVLVKITTDDGLVGWGETAPLGDVQGLIEKQLAGIIIGQDPLNHRKLWRDLWGPYFGSGLAVGAVDVALHDIRGKALNQSVADMYGGRLRDRVQAYASAMNYTEGIAPEDQYPAEARELVARGFRAMKMRIGQIAPKRDLAAAARVREAVGPDIKLMADGNGAYTIPRAIEVGNELEKLGFYWFEEPLPEYHYVGYEVLREKLGIALSGGEGLDSRAMARELICRRAFDIIQPDISLCGGITENLFVAEMARLWNIMCMPHCWGGAITAAATLQVLSLIPDATWGYATESPLLELDTSENPFRDKIIKQPFKLVDGGVDVPTGPGLGIEIDEEIVKQYVID